MIFVSKTQTLICRNALTYTGQRAWKFGAIPPRQCNGWTKPLRFKTLLHGVTHTHTYIHIYMQTCIHTYIHTSTHTYIHTYKHANVHTYIHTNIHRYICTYIHINRRAHVHVLRSSCYIYAYIHTCICTYIHTNKHSCIHTYLHAYTQTYIYTGMHTCTARAARHTFTTASPVLRARVKILKSQNLLCQMTSKLLFEKFVLSRRHDQRFVRG